MTALSGALAQSANDHSPMPKAAAAGPLRMVALGDSLTAGYMLPPADAFPSVLQKALHARGFDVVIANAGVSGDTTSGGLDRLDWSVPEGTQAVILELGANDMLRGLDPKQAEANLAATIERLRSRGIAVMLAGMYAAPNLGAGYREQFDAIYPVLARRFGLTLYPFFLDGVTGQKDLTLPDGLHPTAAGVRVMVERILPMVETFVRDVSGQAPAPR